MIPVDLSRPFMSAGFRTPPFNPHTGGRGRQSPAAQGDADLNARGPRTAQAYGMSEALAYPIDVQSGSWAEALAEALAGGLHGRSARTMYAEQLAQDAAERQSEQARAGLDDELTRARIAALQSEAATANAPQWDDPEPMAGGYTQQRNRRTNERRILTRPQPPAQTYPDDEWEAF